MPFTDLVRQVSILLSLPSVIFVAVAAAVIVIARDWRTVLFAYGLLSAVLALLLSQVIPTEWALLQAIVGGMVAVMLFLSARQLRGAHPRGTGFENAWPLLSSLSSFRLLVVVLAAVGFIVIRSRVHLPLVTASYQDAVIWLVLMGLLGLALHEEPLHAGLSLLMILEGCLLLLYQLTQQRILVGFMEGWQLLLGLAMSYLTLARGLATDEVSDRRSLRWRL
jgi:hypothetical protein